MVPLCLGRGPERSMKGSMRDFKFIMNCTYLCLFSFPLFCTFFTFFFLVFCIFPDSFCFFFCVPTSSHTNLCPSFSSSLSTHFLFILLSLHPFSCLVPHLSVISFSTTFHSLSFAVFFLIFNYVLCSLPLPACPNPLLFYLCPFLCSTTFSALPSFYI